MCKRDIRCFIATTLAVLLIVVPVMAQESEAITVSTSPGSAIHATATFNLVQDRSFHKHLEGEITSESGEVVRLTATNKSVIFGDGYGLTSEIVADTPAETVVRVTVTNGTGEAASSVITYNKLNQTAAPSPNAAAARDLLSRSHDFGFLAATLPALASALQSAAAKRATAVPMSASVTANKHLSIKAMVGDGIDASLFGCIGAILVLMGAALLMVAACVIPEPLEPIACLGAILTYVGCAVLAIDSCF